MASFAIEPLESEVVAPILAYPTDGVVFKVFKDFVDGIGREALEGLTTTKVCELFVKPRTLELQSSYCDYLKVNELADVEKASVFVSHAWGYLFLELYDTLANHFQKEPKTIIWFDLFSNNQHLAAELDFDWWSNTFYRAIQSFGRVVLVLMPYDKPVVFTRAWCLFEIYTTIATESVFEVALNAREMNAFLDAICDDDETYLNLLGDIDVRKANAFKESDKEQIFQAIERMEGGFAGVNGKICEKIVIGW